MLSMHVGTGYNQELGIKVINAVQDSLIGALGIDAEEVVSCARLVQDLSAESIDDIDITLRLEGILNIKMYERVDLQNKVIDLTKRVYNLAVEKKN